MDATRLILLIVLPLFGAAVVYFLREASPVFFDGSGPMPSFYWGHAILPTLGEYYSHRSYFDFLFLRPYIVAALIVIVLGCGSAGTLSRHVRIFSSHTFWAPAGVTLVLLLLASVVSDAGILFGAWRGPTILLRHDALRDLPVMAQIHVPLSVLSAIAISGESYFDGA